MLDVLPWEITQRQYTSTGIMLSGFVPSPPSLQSAPPFTYSVKTMYVA